jgi:putative membrane protein
MKNQSNLLYYLSTSIVAALCLTASPCSAADKGERGQLSSSDYKFLCEAAKGGIAEVELGQLASQKGNEPAIREFGQRMVTDHQKANEELKQLAAQKSATLPDEAEKKDERAKEHLTGLAGADFDQAYLKMMVKDHKKDVKEFQKQSESAEDPAIKDWATKTLPTLQAHLEQAEDLAGNNAKSETNK